MKIRSLLFSWIVILILKILMAIHKWCPKFKKNNKSNIIDDEPAVFILGDEEIALAESTSNLVTTGRMNFREVILHHLEHHGF